MAYSSHIRQPTPSSPSAGLFPARRPFQAAQRETILRSPNQARRRFRFRLRKRGNRGGSRFGNPTY